MCCLWKNEPRIEGKQMVKIVYNPKDASRSKIQQFTIKSSANSRVYTTLLFRLTNQLVKTCWMAFFVLGSFKCLQQLRQIKLCNRTFMSLKWNPISDSEEFVRETRNQTCVLCGCSVNIANQSRSEIPKDWVAAWLQSQILFSYTFLVSVIIYAKWYKCHKTEQLWSFAILFPMKHFLFDTSKNS